MASISEEMSPVAIELLLKALESLTYISSSLAKTTYSIGKDGITSVSRASASTVVGLINHIRQEHAGEYDAKTMRALHKLEKSCEQAESEPKRLTLVQEDAQAVEFWLKKQDVLYVSCTPKNKTSSKNSEKTPDEITPALTTIFFMEKDAKAVENAAAIQAFQAGLINELPSEAFFLLYDDKEDIFVVDELDFFELATLRQMAKEFGLGYTAIANEPEEKEGSKRDTYKVVCEKGSADKLMSIMRLVAWNMTSEHAEKIKEKVLERQSIPAELERLVEKGVRSGARSIADETGARRHIENATYIVNAMAPHQYVKLTAAGFHLFKGGEKGTFVSKEDPDYKEKLEDALADFADYTIFDSLEWEKGGLDKFNIRKEKIQEKLSLLPPKHSLAKDEENIERAHKKRREAPEPIPETAWLFHKYDPETQFLRSEVIEENYNQPSEPLERVVSEHYNAASKHSEKYKYYDLESDEKSVDNIISAATKRVSGKETEKVVEKEVTR